MKTIIKGAIIESTKMHLYDVKTIGKHPVHVIEGGDILTEDERVFNECSDCGWFFLNQKDYDYFKSHEQDIEITYEE